MFVIRVINVSDERLEEAETYPPRSTVLTVTVREFIENPSTAADDTKESRELNGPVFYLGKETRILQR